MSMFVAIAVFAAAVAEWYNKPADRKLEIRGVAATSEQERFM